MGFGVFFVSSVGLVRFLRPSVLLDPDPTWALPRLLLGLFVIGASVSTGGAAAGLFLVLDQLRGAGISERRFTLEIEEGRRILDQHTHHY